MKTDTFTNQAVDKSKSLLTIREGRKNRVYMCSRGYLTVGIGHKITPADGPLKRGDTITDQQIDGWFHNDIRWALRAAMIQMQDFGYHSVDLLAALISVNFQLGPKWHIPTRNGGKGFVKTYDHIKGGKTNLLRYDKAVHNLRQSAWYEQTPVRVEDFIKAIEHLKSLLTH